MLMAPAQASPAISIQAGVSARATAISASSASASAGKSLRGNARYPLQKTTSNSASAMRRAMPQRMLGHATFASPGARTVPMSANARTLKSLAVDEDCQPSPWAAPCKPRSINGSRYPLNGSAKFSSEKCPWTAKV